MALNEAGIGPFRTLRGWQVEVAEPRFFGLSALAVRGDWLIASTDSGVVVDLPRPGGNRRARLQDLPAGPGYPTYKRNRDSEALAVTDNGWLVSFENRHGLWRYDRDWTAGARLLSLAGRGWPANGGVEAMVASADGSLLLLPERAGELLELRAGRLTRWPLHGRTGGIADAVRLPDGRTVVAVREIGLGLRNRLAWLERDGSAYRLRPFVTLPLGMTDNVEGLAAESLPGGGTRLWAVTDSDGWRRTLLLALDLPSTGESRPRPGRGGSGSR